jgi:tetratricopeptide (TPR) repeat protein
LSSGTGSYRDILKDKDESVKLEQESRAVKTDDVAERLIAEYETRLVNEPRNMTPPQCGGALYQKKQFDKALDYYDRIRTSEAGADPTLEKAIADTTIRRFDHLISQLDPTDPGQAEQAEQLTKEKVAFQLEETRKRAERYPTDLQIKFELGQLYFQAGKINEAIQEFQKAQSNPNRRLQAMSFLAQCLPPAA